VSAADFESVACEASHAAGRVLRRRFRETGPLKIESKGLHDFVTEVDREAEDAVLSYIRQRYPDHGIMSEEDSPEVVHHGMRWVVDPLDGTTNFIHGVCPFSVSVALEDDDGLVAGVIHDPFHEETFHAHRGGGARLNGEPISCSQEVDNDQAVVATGFPFRELERLPQYMKSFEAVVRSTAGIRRAGSAAIDLAYTACGRYDAFWEVGLSRWDIAAGTLLVQEAGGIVTDIAGDNRMLDSGDIVAGGKALHGFMLGVTREAFGGAPPR